MITMDSKLAKAIAEAASAVRRESCADHESLRRANVEVGDLLFALVDQGNSNAATTENQAQRVSLTANLIQSSPVVENLVLSGFYWSAAAVLRQHMETLARVIEIRSGRPTGGKKPPNVSVLPYRLSLNYGGLSELVHTSGGELLGDLAEGREGPEFASVKPCYREQWAKDLLCLHIAQMVTLAREIDLLHRETYPGRNLIDADGVLAKVSRALVDAGFWEELPGCESQK